MTFDIKLDGSFMRKARYVADGHTTDTLTNITYSSIISMKSVRIAFLLVSLLDLKVLASDIGSTYINVLCRERMGQILESYYKEEL